MTPPRSLLVVVGLAAVAVLLVAGRLHATTTSADPADHSAAEKVAKRFWEYSTDAHCRQAADLVWSPIDRQGHQDDYVAQCRNLDTSDSSVDFGTARSAESASLPYGAQDLVAVPLTLHRDGQPDDERLLALVEVDGQWYVSL